MLQCTHDIIMSQNVVLFMALLEDPSLIRCPSPIFILCRTCFWCATYFDDTSYRGMGARDVVQIIMNHFLYCQMNHLSSIIVIKGGTEIYA